MRECGTAGDRVAQRLVREIRVIQIVIGFDAIFLP
jgi:hypothetical protein